MTNSSSQAYRDFVRHNASPTMRAVFDLEAEDVRDVSWVLSEGSVVATANGITLSTLNVENVNEMNDAINRFNRSSIPTLTGILAIQGKRCITLLFDSFLS